MLHNYLLPECNFEREMLTILGYSIKTDIYKANGCNGVITRIKNEYKGKLAIGWIDEDPTQHVNRHPDYFNYTEVGLAKYKVHFKRKGESNNYLIEIEGEFEPWFEPIGSSKQIRKADFKIKNPLHEYSKNEVPPNVKEYLRRVVEANPAPFDYIRYLIERVKNNQ
ncbi:MAG TPA: hypothetical protein VG603_02960 [Chitinophagales bacterium]|nr:hypothetical protein [Chitinophagales bacterium]